MPTVVLIGTLDTKGREHLFMRDCLLAAGVDVVLVDIGVLADPPVSPDVTAAEVAAAAGASLDALRFTREGSDTRAVALAAMERGATSIVRRLHAQGRCDAMLGAAGSGGSTVISGVMRAMPLGMPKLLVSTMAASAAAFFGTRDITIMHSVTDIAGLNRVSTMILRNAARAVAGMVNGRELTDGGGKPLVAITMFGVTTPGVLRVQERLEQAGFDTIVFHAVGSGGRAMEQMIDDGLIDGVVDYTISELTDEHLGGVFGAGPDRLTAAGRRGLPQVVVPGAIEVLNFGPRATVPRRFDVPERRLIVHNPHVCAVRTTQSEAVELARILSGKLNRATGPTAVLLPLQGLDSYQQRPDGPFIDEEADAAFFAELRRTLRPNIPCREEPLNINHPVFADAVAETFLTLWRERRDRPEAKP
ncbi:MAG: Tm-1-like ATP-binding domain-containing protein [Pseudomonadota bacterium]|nr:Tm-1-like ATP-binding domain-containing protein [Pseudomonadota bacterium]